MIAVLQRVLRASCYVEQELTGEIHAGLTVLLGVAKCDIDEDAIRLAGKIARCRIFPDETGRSSRSIREISGAALVIPNFTLLADYVHGNRPSYFNAASPEEAKLLYKRFIIALGEEGVPVATGRFGAHMQIDSVTDGPVTIVMDSRQLPLREGSCQ